MPEVTATGREKILQYLEEHNTSINDLSVMYNVNKQDMADYLAGRRVNKRGNELILRIITDFKIR